jgi:hypothetical protein
MTSIEYKVDDGIIYFRVPLGRLLSSDLLQHLIVAFPKAPLSEVRKPSETLGLLQNNFVFPFKLYFTEIDLEVCEIYREVNHVFWLYCGRTRLHELRLI